MATPAIAHAVGSNTGVVIDIAVAAVTAVAAAVAAVAAVAFAIDADVAHVTVAARLATPKHKLNHGCGRFPSHKAEEAERYTCDLACYTSSPVFASILGHARLQTIISQSKLPSMQLNLLSKGFPNAKPQKTTCDIKGEPDFVGSPPSASSNDSHPHSTRWPV